MSHLTSHHTLPPFAEGIQTAPLVSISLNKLESKDHAESLAFFKAAKELGFFYLDMNQSSLGERIVSEAEKLNEIQKVFFQLPNEVKDQYGRDKVDPFFAYRFAALQVRDAESGSAKRNESYNVCPSSNFMCIPEFAWHGPYSYARTILLVIVHVFLVILSSSKIKLSLNPIRDIAEPLSTYSWLSSTSIFDFHSTH